MQNKERSVIGSSDIAHCLEDFLKKQAGESGLIKKLTMGVTVTRKIHGAGML
jgi:hypothetical protein